MIAVQVNPFYKFTWIFTLTIVNEMYLTSFERRNGFLSINFRFTPSINFAFGFHWGQTKINCIQRETGNDFEDRGGTGSDENSKTLWCIFWNDCENIFP